MWLNNKRFGQIELVEVSCTIPKQTHETNSSFLKHVIRFAIV